MLYSCSVCTRWLSLPWSRQNTDWFTPHDPFTWTKGMCHAVNTLWLYRMLHWARLADAEVHWPRVWKAENKVSFPFNGYLIWRNSFVIQSRFFSLNITMNLAVLLTPLLSLLLCLYHHEAHSIKNVLSHIMTRTTYSHPKHNINYILGSQSSFTNYERPHSL